MSTKPNAHAPMSLVLERANAASAFPTISGLKSFPLVSSPPKWKRLMTALSADLFRHSTPEVAEKANLVYIINDE